MHVRSWGCSIQGDARVTRNLFFNEKSIKLSAKNKSLQICREPGRSLEFWMDRWSFARELNRSSEYYCTRLRFYSHCVADIRGSRREAAQNSDLTVHTTKCGVAVAAAWNVIKHGRLIERMTMLFKCFYIRTTLNVFFFNISEGNKWTKFVLYKNA